MTAKKIDIKNVSLKELKFISDNVASQVCNNRGISPGHTTSFQKKGIAFYLDAKADRMNIDQSRIINVQDFLKDRKDDILVINDCNGNYYQLYVKKG